jgi:CheY-like chemotaxis protein
MASLKKDAGTGNVPVLVASTIEDHAKAFHLGADAYLVKPVERADLLRTLRRLTADPAMCRVLIIDDNNLDRYLLKQHLKNLPVSITEEIAGVPGIARANESAPDLIFLDLTMPDMTGFEVLDELKRRRETQSIPVIIVTSRVLTDSERQRLLDQRSTILGKDTLDQTIVGDAVRRVLKDSASQ